MLIIENNAAIPGKKKVTIDPELFDEVDQNIEEFIKLIIKRIDPKVTEKQLELYMKKVKLWHKTRILNPHLKGKAVNTPSMKEITDLLEISKGPSIVTLRLQVPVGVPTENFAQGSLRPILKAQQTSMARSRPSSRPSSRLRSRPSSRPTSRPRSAPMTTSRPISAPMTTSRPRSAPTTTSRPRSYKTGGRNKRRSNKRRYSNKKHSNKKNMRSNKKKVRSNKKKRYPNKK